MSASKLCSTGPPRPGPVFAYSGATGANFLASASCHNYGKTTAYLGATKRGEVTA